MAYERLLERLQILGGNSDAEAEDPTSGELKSVIRHLQKLLNTRQGSVQIAPDYGVPDMTNIPGESITGAGRRMERVLMDVLRRFEPRLTSISIQMDEREHSVLELRFKLEARLTRQPDVPVVFETVINNSGNVTIKL